jgi:hypothetical protein
VAPSGLSYTSPTIVSQGVAMTALSPTVTGTVTSYSVSPALPAGISLNTTSGQISGIPTATAPQATYKITAANSAGSTTFGWVLTVRSSSAITGTAASGAPIASATVTLKDSSSPAKTASSTTDANGSYTFTAAQIQGFTPPFMLEIVTQAGGNPSLHSAVSSEDVASGGATINITPLTDLVIANIANDTAADLFTKEGYANLLTKTALDSAVQALDKLLQPVLAQMSVPADVDLLHQSFTANGQGLDAVLDAVRVSVDAATRAEVITNRLNDNSISGSLSTPPTTPLTTPSTNNLADLQAISALFDSFSNLLAKAQAPTGQDPGVRGFFSTSFDVAKYLHEGQAREISVFESRILGAADEAKSAGAEVTLGDIVLSSVPSWVRLQGAVGYMVSFTLRRSNAPNDRISMVVYNSNGTWLLIGDQLATTLKISAFAGSVNRNDPTGGTRCSGLELSIGAIDQFKYAIVTGPGLPQEGVLLFHSVWNGISVAGVPPAQYNGGGTPLASNLCGSAFFNSDVYVMSDSQIQAITVPAIYTVRLYHDNNTPADLSDDTLFATYTQEILAAPLQSAALTYALFPDAFTADPTVVSAATSSAAPGTSTISWIAPTASGLYANSVRVKVGGFTTSPTLAVYGNATDIPVAATSVSASVPYVPEAGFGGVSVIYNDSLFRRYSASEGSSSF